MFSDPPRCNAFRILNPTILGVLKDFLVLFIFNELLELVQLLIRIQSSSSELLKEYLGLWLVSSCVS
jgi:hypothetical protein